MENKTQILLVDDHVMLMESMAAILNMQPDLEVTGMASSVQEALERIKDRKVDLAVVDYSLKEEVGSQVVEALKKELPNLKFLAISSLYDKSSVKAMVKAGAIGFVLKDADIHELLEAIRATASGRNYFSREVSAILLDDLLANKPPTSRANFACKPSDLTEREVDVLREIVNEKTNKEIADSLYISIKTVENHRQNLMQKIGARNTAGLVRFALQNGLVE